MQTQKRSVSGGVGEREVRQIFSWRWSGWIRRVVPAQVPALLQEVRCRPPCAAESSRVTARPWWPPCCVKTKRCVLESHCCRGERRAGSEQREKSEGEAQALSTWAGSSSFWLRSGGQGPALGCRDPAGGSTWWRKKQ